jgi:hypothetical protein
MFKDFYQFLNVPERKDYNSISLDSMQRNTTGFSELFGSYNSESFGEGLYRLHDVSRISYWNEILSKTFPEFSERLSCFGYDWLGRQFALDKQK